MVKYREILRLTHLGISQENIAFSWVTYNLLRTLTAAQPRYQRTRPWPSV